LIVLLDSRADWPETLLASQFGGTMNVYQCALDFLLTMPVLGDWPELRALLIETTSKNPKHWQLPVITCQAVGGVSELALPAVAAIGCAQIGILLVDDMLDDDPRGAYRQVGPAKAANYAAAFQAAGSEIVLSNHAPLATRLLSCQHLNHMLLTLSLGQHLDVQMPINETAFWRIVEYKSASFFGTAFYLGALFGGASDDKGMALKKIGGLYGELIQIHDDLRDTMAVPASPDWLQGRSPLPILFAKIVDHPERSRFLELCREITDEDALQEAQDILVRCGAVSYCVDQLLHRYQSAREALQAIELAHPELIESLLEEAIAPVRKLFDAIGGISTW
jgi:geranylgeranyl pyrophosphate synthase